MKMIQNKTSLQKNGNISNSPNLPPNARFDVQIPHWLFDRNNHIRPIFFWLYNFHDTLHSTLQWIIDHVGVVKKIHNY